MKIILSSILAATMMTSMAYATSFNVTRLDDPVPDGCSVNDCSLREAVIAADQTQAKDTIVLPAGTYLIDLTGSDSSETTGDLDISTDMLIVGASSIIDGQKLGRIMDIRSDANVTLRNLTLRNANYPYNGGALNIGGGSLTLEAVTFEDNSGGGLGGAIYAFDDAVVNIDSCLFVNNIGDSGAAIANFSSSTGITVRKTVFRGNKANQRGIVYLSGRNSDSLLEDVTFDQNLANGSGGGAIFFLGRKLLIDGLIATGNQVTGGKGGAVLTTGTAHAKEVRIVNAIFEGNKAKDGGAISVSGSPDLLDITHSSFISNVATNNGGALYLTGGMLDVTNVTFSGNQASSRGGAFYIVSSTVLTMLHNTLSGGSASSGNALYINLTSSGRSAELANNLIDGDCDISDVDDMTSLGGNIEGSGDTCVFDAGSDLVSQSKVQLGLLPLADNLGGTPTHKLTAVSVARGQGELATCASVKIDQLFENRGSPCNSGADESDTVFRDSFEAGKTSP
jgi:predicted outer membrane repeat protein